MTTVHPHDALAQRFGADGLAALVKAAAVDGIERLHMLQAGPLAWAIGMKDGDVRHYYVVYGGKAERFAGVDGLGDVVAEAQLDIGAHKDDVLRFIELTGGHVLEEPEPPHFERRALVFFCESDGRVVRVAVDGETLGVEVMSPP